MKKENSTIPAFANVAHEGEDEGTVPRMAEPVHVLAEMMREVHQTARSFRNDFAPHFMVHIAPLGANASGGDHLLTLSNPDDPRHVFARLEMRAMSLAGKDELEAVLYEGSSTHPAMTQLVGDHAEITAHLCTVVKGEIEARNVRHVEAKLWESKLSSPLSDVDADVAHLPDIEALDGGREVPEFGADYAGLNREL